MDYGATGDGTTNDAKAIDSTIAACAAAGGGIVHFPPGRYVSGTIHVKSNVTIEISSGATVATSGDDDDIDDIEEFTYNPDADEETMYFNPSLFRLDGIENACIQGGGTIDGNRPGRQGPKPIAVKRCTRITIRDIKIVNAPNYAISFIDSDGILVENAWIEHAFADGIDLDGCRFARVSNCRVSSRDDAICLKASPSLGEPIDCAHVTITNCILLTSATCFKLGTESGPGDFTDITLSNCTFGPLLGTASHPTAISILTVDGGAIERIAIDNITMDHVGSPFNLRLGNRGRGQKVPTPGRLQDVMIGNIVGTGIGFPMVISGIPGHRIKNVSIHDVSMEIDAAAIPYLNTTVDPADVPEAESKYPGAGMFGPLPAWALYCRHTENIQVRDVQARVNVSLAELKPAVTCDDVERSSIAVDEIMLE
ncbi:MAG TPA: glycosyl hydrolase family 28 protein [Candidatus Lokiarchaeia archaeon]|nr:glycosyl hydrolase family 28 protein [Candidatus Lokiarchaeia archaeon]